MLLGLPHHSIHSELSVGMDVNPWLNIFSLSPSSFSAIIINLFNVYLLVSHFYLLPKVGQIFAFSCFHGFGQLTHHPDLSAFLGQS